MRSRTSINIKASHVLTGNQNSLMSLLLLMQRLWHSAIFLLTGCKHPLTICYTEILKRYRTLTPHHPFSQEPAQKSAVIDVSVNRSLFVLYRNAQKMKSPINTGRC
jgi:hypothetical protein